MTSQQHLEVIAVIQRWQRISSVIDAKSKLLEEFADTFIDCFHNKVSNLPCMHTLHHSFLGSPFMLKGILHHATRICNHNEMYGNEALSLCSKFLQLPISSYYVLFCNNFSMTFEELKAATIDTMSCLKEADEDPLDNSYLMLILANVLDVFSVVPDSYMESLFRKGEIANRAYTCAKFCSKLRRIIVPRIHMPLTMPLLFTSEAAIRSAIRASDNYDTESESDLE